MKILVACEFSGIVRNAFSARGHNAVSCDLLPTEAPGNHYTGDVLDILYSCRWELLIAHPPCTFLCNSGVRHLHDTVCSRNGVRAKIYGAQRWEELEKASIFFNKLKNCEIPKICIENPVPHKYAKERIGSYSQLIQPWQFGHGETKATCLWLKNLPKLIPTNVVEGREHRIHNMAPSKDRAKNRSRTFRGIAEAMAEQWG